MISEITPKAPRSSINARIQRETSALTAARIPPRTKWGEIPESTNSMKSGGYAYVNPRISRELKSNDLVRRNAFFDVRVYIGTVGDNAALAQVATVKPVAQKTCTATDEPYF